MRGWGWRKQGKNWDQREMGLHRVKWGLFFTMTPFLSTQVWLVNESPRAKSRANPKCPLLDSLKPALLYSSLLEPW